MKEYIIDGNKFNCYNEAYAEIRSVLSNGMEKENISITEIVKKYIDNNEECNVIWKNSTKSEKDLGFEETARFFKKRLQIVPLHELVQTLNEAKSAEQNKGETLFIKVLNAFKINGIEVILE